MGSMQSLGQDVRTALRVLARTPGATVLSIISVAMGIGLTVGIFSIADAMLLRPFPLERPAEVLYAVSRGEDGREIGYGWPDFEDMRGATQGHADVVAYQRRSSMLVIDDEKENLLTHIVTPEYFSLLGVKAALGRASVEGAEGRPAAVIGYRLWHRRFGGNPSIVGNTILLARAQRPKAFVVAGVMPAEFVGLMRGVATDVWVSTDAWFEVLEGDRERRERNGQFEIIARLKHGVTAENLAARLDAAIRGPEKHKPAASGASGTVLAQEFAPGWKDTLIGGGGTLAVLGLVLFVACANVAQLRLAQAESRRREFGIRLALGAGGSRVVRQLLVETAIVSAAGLGIGLLAANVIMERASEFLSGGRVYIDYGIRLDYRVLAFALAAGMISVLLAGMAPARHSVRLDLAEVLKSEQGTAAGGSGWQKTFLIIGQIAVSVALFGGAMMLIINLRTAAAVRPGFEPDKKLLVMGVGPGWKDRQVLWCEQMCEHLSGLPGVRGATFARRLPLSGSGGGATVPVEISGQPPLSVRFNNVGGNYFSLMGTRVVAGRGIDASDRQGTGLAIVVSQGFARRVFGERNPLGEWITVSGAARQVVGIAEDGPANHLHEEAEPFIYFPFAQVPSGDITLMVETAGEPGGLAQAVRRELRNFDALATLFWMTTLREHMDRALARDRMFAALSQGLCSFALLLTGAGLFGVVQYSVHRRTREFGLRAALGAEPAALRRMVLVDAARMAAWGVPIGLILLSGAAYYLRSLLLGVSPLNPVLYLASAAAALLVALLAAWIPARRATRVDPLTALRYE